MARVRTELEIDEQLLRLIDERAAASGQARDEIVEDALRRQLRAREFALLVADVRRRSGLTDDEALALAYSELDAIRAERASSTSR
jgi:hypothetical protein